MEKILLGSHVSMTKTQNYLVGSVNEMLAQGANTFMIFTGAPQNTKRTPVAELGIKEMIQLLEQQQIKTENLVVHAPYIINLANQFNEINWQFSVDFLTNEVKRTEEIGISLIVLHPGFSLGGESNKSLNQIVRALNIVTANTRKATIALETMSGKKNELGATLEEIAYVLKNVNQPERVGVCLDTCHLHDAGYDLANWEQFKETFEKIIGIEKIKVIHLNDSKHDCGSHRDRHENLGYGKIGFDNLMHIAWDPTFSQIPKILETPLKKTKSAHQAEIKALQNRTFINFLESN